jgi:hypothetical protein
MNRREVLSRPVARELDDITNKSPSHDDMHPSPAAQRGRELAQTAEARGMRVNTQRANAIAQHSWKESNLPAWLTPKVFSERIQPLLAQVSSSVIAQSIGVSPGDVHNRFLSRPILNAKHSDSIILELNLVVLPNYCSGCVPQSGPLKNSEKSVVNVTSCTPEPSGLAV